MYTEDTRFVRLKGRKEVVWLESYKINHQDYITKRELEHDYRY